MNVNFQDGCQYGPNCLDMSTICIIYRKRDATLAHSDYLNYNIPFNYLFHTLLNDVYFNVTVVLNVLQFNNVTQNCCSKVKLSRSYIEYMYSDFIFLPDKLLLHPTLIPYVKLSTVKLLLGGQ